MPHDVCPSCGAELPFREADICWKCGFRIKPLPEGAEKSDKRAVIIAFGLLVVPILISAIIAAIIFGMASGVERTKDVAATAHRVGNDIYVTWEGGRDTGLVTSYQVVLNDHETLGGIPPIVGNSVRIGNSTQDYNHVVVTATFTDGSDQLVLDIYV